MALPTSVDVPEKLFQHVEKSLSNGVSCDMLVEIAHQNDPDLYWIGKITMVCGHLLRICYIGTDIDLWVDVTKTTIHSLGWCAQSGELLCPPKEVHKLTKGLINKVLGVIEMHMSVPEDVLDYKALPESDRITLDMKIEVQSATDPYKFWIAFVVQNCGGRLLLRYIGSEDSANDFWLFYTSNRIHRIGYTYSMGQPFEMVYPYKEKNSSDLLNDINSILEKSDNSPEYPPSIIPQEPTLINHNLEVGMKLEAINPANMFDVCPATVMKIYNNINFLVTIDHIEGYDEDNNSWLCDSSHPYIFQVGWANANNVNVCKPSSWTDKDDFSWDRYLPYRNSNKDSTFLNLSSAADLGFEVGMKLEAVNPMDPSKICTGLIQRIVRHLLLVKLEATDTLHWFSFNSSQIFPVGWCESNEYTLTEANTKIESPVEVEQCKKPVNHFTMLTEDAPRISIYFNYKCYSGPFISKNKLSQLPKVVGPGLVGLVIREVLTKIISVAYKPGRMLDDLKYEGKPQPGLKLELFKAKLQKVKDAYIQVVDEYDQVADFCKEICSKLQACPYLFGQTQVVDQCPEQCSMVNKAKFQNALSKKRNKFKGKNAKANVTKCLNAGKKKKKRMHFMTIRAQERRAAMETPDKEGNESGNDSEPSPSSTPRHSESGTRPNSPDSNSDPVNKKQPKKRVTRSNIPPLEMKTRGAKLPNFAVQMKENHWDKKDVETIYNKSYVVPRKQYSDDSESDNSGSCNSLDIKNNGELDKISDVSDSEEPELKKLRVTPLHETTPMENKTFSFSDTSTSNQSFNRSSSPLPVDPSKWSQNELYNYLTRHENFEDVAKKLYDEEIDGAAFLMLNIQTINEYLQIKNEPASRLCECLSQLKWVYFSQRSDIDNKL